MLSSFGLFKKPRDNGAGGSERSSQGSSFGSESEDSNSKSVESSDGSDVVSNDSEEGQIRTTTICESAIEETKHEDEVTEEKPSLKDEIRRR